MWKNEYLVSLFEMLRIQSDLTLFYAFRRRRDKKCFVLQHLFLGQTSVTTSSANYTTAITIYIFLSIYSFVPVVYYSALITFSYDSVTWYLLIGIIHIFLLINKNCIKSLLLTIYFPNDVWIPMNSLIKQEGLVRNCVVSKCFLLSTDTRGARTRMSDAVELFL